MGHGSRRPARTKNRGARAARRLRSHRGLEWRQKALGIGIARQPPLAVAAQRVGRPHAASDLVAFVGTLERVDLERRRDARTRDANRVGKREEVGVVRCRQWQIDRVPASGAQCRVVHRRRQRVSDRPADHAVERGIPVEPPESKLTTHAGPHDLAGRHAFARVAPSGSKPLGKNTSRDACFSHRNQHRGFAGGAGDFSKPHAVAQDIARCRRPSRLRRRWRASPQPTPDRARACPRSRDAR